MDSTIIYDLAIALNFAKPPNDIRIHLLSDSVRAKLLFESDVFWARASIGREVLDLWSDTYQTSRSFRKRGIVELELP